MCMKEWEIPNKNTPPFKVGDKVKILPRNSPQEDYYPQYVDGMLKYVGQLATITQVMKTSCNIDLDDSSYYWPFNALQLVTSEIGETVDPHKLKNGDYIKLTSALCKNTSLIYIVKEVKDNVIYRHASYSLSDKNISVDSDRHWFVIKTTEITYATEEERKLLNNALLKEGFIWNDLTKQLESVGEVNVSLTNTYSTGINVQPLDLSSIQASIQNFYDYTKLLNHTKEEPQTETELNLFPKKKHYQLNFNY